MKKYNPKIFRRWGTQDERLFRLRMMTDCYIVSEDDFLKVVNGQELKGIFITNLKEN